MDVRIGITQSARELDIELADDVKQESIKKQVSEALGTEDGMLWLTDRKGREYGVPVAKISYVEIGSANESRNMGFSA